MPEVVVGGKHCLGVAAVGGGHDASGCESRSLVNGASGIVFVWYSLCLAVFSMYARSIAEQDIALFKDETKNG
ncbi:MAG TPA: hypothetical protein PKC79_00910 [Solidesulfovibrio magneticus]|nr:hypothetical protein [Solidesulfovibrio magneticus]